VPEDEPPPLDKPSLDEIPDGEDFPPPLLETAGGVGSSLLLSLQALNVNVMANITIAVNIVVMRVFMVNLRNW
jgi:hypothetical protein